MRFEIELNMFMPGKVRIVHVPRENLMTKSLFQQLDQIFFHGQNEIDPQELPSVSAGDVIRFEGERYLIQSVGFRKLKPDEYVQTQPKLEDVFQFNKPTRTKTKS